jgi:hypothetical protein
VQGAHGLVEYMQSQTVRSKVGPIQVQFPFYQRQRDRWLG